MPILIMPITPRQIRPHLIILLGILHNLHIHVHDRHALGAAPQSRQSARVRDADLRETRVAFSGRTARVGENYRFGRLSAWR